MATIYKYHMIAPLDIIEHKVSLMTMQDTVFIEHLDKVVNSEIEKFISAGWKVKTFETDHHKAYRYHVLFEKETDEITSY